MILDPDEIDELGLSLFCTRVSHEAETLSFHGDIETVMVNAEKLLHVSFIFGDVFIQKIFLFPCVIFYNLLTYLFIHIL